MTALPAPAILVRFPVHVPIVQSPMSSEPSLPPSGLPSRLVRELLDRGLQAATAESCTGGLVAAALTDVPGVSACYLGGVVSYANSVKEGVLGVPASVLETVGAVSSECAEAMARGVREKLGADLAVSTTGIAGPGGGTAAKPVGLVYFGVATATGARSVRHVFAGDRAAVRAQAAETALSLLLEAARGGQA